jgi:hypothetical protein
MHALPVLIGSGSPSVPADATGCLTVQSAGLW